MEQNREILQIENLQAEVLLQKFESMETVLQKIMQVIEVPTQKLITRQETANKLHITLKTLDTWDKLGVVKGCKIGNRVLYNSEEVMKAVISHKKGGKL